jgi:hypothetical protein
MPKFEGGRGGAKPAPDHAPLRDWRAMKAALFGFNAALGGGVIRS